MSTPDDGPWMIVLSAFTVTPWEVPLDAADSPKCVDSIVSLRSVSVSSGPELATTVRPLALGPSAQHKLFEIGPSTEHATSWLLCTTMWSALVPAPRVRA